MVLNRIVAAHISKDGRIQSLKEHCENTGMIASTILTPCNLKSAGMFLGIGHDMGKSTSTWQNKLYANSDESIPHASYFMKYIHDSALMKIDNVQNYSAFVQNFLGAQYHKPTDIGVLRLACEIIAFAGGAHHSLFDVCTSEGSAVIKRINKIVDYDETAKIFFNEVINEHKFEELFHAAVLEVYHKLQILMLLEMDEFQFDRSLFARFLCAALRDADAKDTCAFEFAASHPKFSKQIMKQVDFQQFWDAQADYVLTKRNGMTPTTKINQVRTMLADQIITAAEHDTCGIHSLELSTGAGKTIDSVLYGTVFNQKNDMHRLIFAIPILRIINQNVTVIKDWTINADTNILEIHSGVSEQHEYEQDTEDAAAIPLDIEDAPIIVTTMYKLFSSLYHKHQKDMRWMLYYINSTLVIDEPQNIPIQTTTLFYRGLNFLRIVANTNIVLSTATNPVQYLPDKRRLEVMDIIPKNYYDTHLDAISVFQRVKIVNMTRSVLSIQDVSDFIAEKMQEVDSFLCILNTRTAVQTLTNLLHEKYAGTKVSIYSISTNLCRQHIDDVCTEISEALSTIKETGNKVIVVATPLFDTGIDLSFQAGIRSKTGLFNIYQTAGRINRNGEYGKGYLYVIQLDSTENISSLPDIINGQDALSNITADLQDNEEIRQTEDVFGRYCNSLFSLADVERKIDYPVRYQERDCSVVKLLSGPVCSVPQKDRIYGFMTQMKSAADSFEVYGESNTVEAIVPYNEESKQIIAALKTIRLPFDYPEFNELMSVASKKYVVKVYETQIPDMINKGMIELYEHCPVYVLSEQCYGKDGVSIV